MSKAIVVINEQHNLMEDQIRVLGQKVDSFDILKVPANGLNIQEQKQAISDIEYIISSLEDGETYVVFASPIPAMIKFALLEFGENVLVFHNDNREKKELPGGKIIMTVAKTGWVLV